VRGVQLALAAAVVAALGVIGGTIWIGSRVREETVVANPYEEGLGHDAERRAREALGLAVTLLDPAPEVGSAPLAFALSDAGGRPLEGAAVSVQISRPETSRDARSAQSRPLGGGRYAADLAFPAPGAWDVRFDVRRGEDRVRLERRVAARAPCDLAAGPCTRPLPGGGEVTLEVAPRPLRTMRELTVAAELKTGPPAPPPDPSPAVSVSFSMPGMEMGENRTALAPAGPGRYAGRAVLVRCPSGRRAWVADVTVGGPGASPRAARFTLTVAE
jgi:nitrogen fixation protein FixH